VDKHLFFGDVVFGHPVEDVHDEVVLGLIPEDLFGPTQDAHLGFVKWH